MLKFIKKLGEVLIGIFLICCVVTTVWSVYDYIIENKKSDSASESSGFDLQLPGETEKAVVTVSMVEAKILEIGEVASCEGDYTVTRGRKFTRHMLDNIPIPMTTNSIELKCKGKVKAGYDLTAIKSRVDEESKTVYVSLPEIQILSNELLWNESLICDEKNNILNPIDFEQYKMLIPEIKSAGLKEAKKQGLIDTVESNAKNLITNFLGCFEDYKVEFI